LNCLDNFALVTKNSLGCCESLTGESKVMIEATHPAGAEQKGFLKLRKVLGTIKLRVLLCQDFTPHYW
jgi:hypothetical protein